MVAERGRVLMAEIGSDRHTLLYVPEHHWQELPQVSFLSRQTRICHDKHVFVATKIILVAAPANDTREERRLSRGKGVGEGGGGGVESLIPDVQSPVNREGHITHQGEKQVVISNHK